MNKYTLNTFVWVLGLFSLVSNYGYSQQALFGTQEIISPEIHKDKSVTFRFYAPQADTVKITGDFLSTVKKKSSFGMVDSPNTALLTKNDKGIWSYTTDLLSPELYSYAFIVDGLRTTDPNNPFLIRDVASITNIFIIDGNFDRGHLFVWNIQVLQAGRMRLFFQTRKHGIIGITNLLCEFLDLIERHQIFF